MLYRDPDIDIRETIGAHTLQRYVLSFLPPQGRLEVGVLLVGGFGLLRGAAYGGGDKATTGKLEMYHLSLHAIAQIEEQRLNLSRS